MIERPSLGLATISAAVGLAATACTVNVPGPADEIQSGSAVEESTTLSVAESSTTIVETAEPDATAAPAQATTSTVASSTSIAAPAASVTEDTGENGEVAAPSTVDYTVPGGFTLHTGREGRFQLALPDHYTVVDLTADDLRGMMRDIEDPRQLELAEEALAEPGQFALFGFDFGAATADFTPNVNVQVYPAGPLEQDLEVFEAQIPPYYESVGIELVRIGRRTIPAGEVLRVEGVIGSGSLTATVVQQIMLEDGMVYSVNFTLLDPDDQDRRAELQLAFQSLATLG